MISGRIFGRNVRIMAKNEERYPTKKQSFSEKKDCFFVKIQFFENDNAPSKVI